MRKMFAKRIFFFSFIVLFSADILAQQGLNTGNVTTGIRKSFDSESITVAGTSIGFTASKIVPTSQSPATGDLRADLATCNNTGAASISILSTGTAATSSNGLIVPAGGTFQVWGYNDISNFRAIRVTSTSSTIVCIYSRLP